MSTLTQHKKAVRNICVNPREFSFVSVSADNIKKWQCRDGKFLKNFEGHNSVVNCCAVNEDGILVTGGDDGTMCFWDYETGYCFQKTQTVVQPGSLDAEAGIYASSFDLSGSRLLTCEADKTIKIWQESGDADESSDPVDIDSWTKQCLKLRRY
jgi:pleiotropic regulator 1